MSEFIVPLLPLYIVIKDDLEGVDNKAIIEELKYSDKRNDNPNTSMGEDTSLSLTGSCKSLLGQIDILFKEAGIPFTHPIRCEELWGQVCKTNMCIPFHSHYDWQHPDIDGYSFVYYPQATEDSGKLIFNLPFGGKRYDRGVDPKTGRLVIFPRCVNHFTRRNLTKGDRICVSGNYTVTV